MSKSMKKSIALLLVFLQLFVLLPVTAVTTRAVEPDADAAPVPTVNPVKEGTVQFGSFNYAGDTKNGRDGVDYLATYYYSDDYFASSAVNPKAQGQKVMNWDDLENQSLVTLSKAFTVASYASNEGLVNADGTKNDVAPRSKNAEQFLADCGFENPFVNTLFNQTPTQDSLGYVFGSKKITVWNGTENEDYTLVAVGVRGGGYGAEWASNITVGDSAAATLENSGTYRHKGFNDRAQDVLSDLQAYTAGIEGKVKYWVVGYSRAGAVANLVAGAITDHASDTYKTTRDDVYGYTFEAPQAALNTEDPNGLVYPNIHNIINKMDLVPLVSPYQFQHARLGVDYLLPYYANAGENNEAYYLNMFGILPKIADLPDVYNAKYEGDAAEDPAVTDARPENYPYNRTIQISNMDLRRKMPYKDVFFYTVQGGNGELLEDVDNANSVIAGENGLMMDQFLSNFADVFILSRGWDRAYFNTSRYDASLMTHSWDSHEHQYVQKYQDSLRSLIGIVMEVGRKKAVDDLMAGLNKLIDPSNSLSGAFSAGKKAATFCDAHIEMENATYDDAYYRQNVYKMESPLASLLTSTVDQTTYLKAYSSEVKTALNNLTPALTWLYAEDYMHSGGEYAGTLFKNLSTILAAHVPELGMSWAMSLDEVFTSDYREITLPEDAVVKLYGYRARIDDPDGDGALMATVESGNLETGDDRITITGRAYETDDAGNTMQMITIRYPGNLDIRFDVTVAEGESFEDMYLVLSDYKPENVVNSWSSADRNDRGNILPDTIQIHHDLVADTENTNSGEINVYASHNELSLAEGETIHVFAQHGVNLPENAAPAEYTLTKTVTVTWLDEDGETELAKAEVISGEAPVYPCETPEKASDKQNDYTFAGWMDEDGNTYEAGEAFQAVTAPMTFTAFYDESPRAYTVTWVVGQHGDEETWHYGEVPSREDPYKPATQDTIFTFLGWRDGDDHFFAKGEALPAVTGDVTYTAEFSESQLLKVQFFAQDVLHKNGGEPSLLSGSQMDSSGVKQQPVYPSFMGYALTGVTVASGSASETVAAVNTNVDLTALNDAIARVTKTSGDNEVSVTAIYEKEVDKTYRVTVENALADGTVLSSYTTDDFVVGDAMQIMAPDTRAKDGQTYYFQYWLVNGEQYEMNTITLRPNEAKDYTVRAVYAPEQAEAKATVVIQNAYAETQNGKNKIAMTMTWSAPGVEQIDRAGFQVSTSSADLTTKVSEKYSALKGSTGTYTLHVNMTGKEARELYARAVLVYTDAEGEHTIYSDPIRTFVWNDLNAIK